ncbi:MAG: hypothetical protein ACI8RD_014646, partial [Bacillariaceae sp.]|jgi:hypothetical protein
VFVFVHVPSWALLLDILRSLKVSSLAPVDDFPVPSSSSSSSISLPGDFRLVDLAEGLRTSLSDIVLSIEMGAGGPPSTGLYGLLILELADEQVESSNSIICYCLCIF